MEISSLTEIGETSLSTTSNDSDITIRRKYARRPAIMPENGKYHVGCSYGDTELPGQINLKEDHHMESSLAEIETNFLPKSCLRFRETLLEEEVPLSLDGFDNEETANFKIRPRNDTGFYRVKSFFCLCFGCIPERSASDEAIRIANTERPTKKPSKLRRILNSVPSLKPRQSSGCLKRLSKVDSLTLMLEKSQATELCSLPPVSLPSAINCEAQDDDLFCSQHLDSASNHDQQLYPEYSDQTENVICLLERTDSSSSFTTVVIDDEETKRDWIKEIVTREDSIFNDRGCSEPTESTDTLRGSSIPYTQPSMT